ncbi:LytTR family DNA-binding domain-containing protein [Bernardetia sp. Wsw4-3y2]|uniref:LytR/AlgR family response regulator transcription factor n=1 Tax=Bernardetia sp. Wsw4-3y2 TaxID=3127471 RepID=UPI0030D1E2C5
MRILIIEDETPIAEDLEATLKSINSQIEIVEFISSVVKGIAYLSKQENQQKIDLIFSDIQLNDGVSFEIFKQVSVPIPIIFCTAYDEYALKAFEANGIDYILKPFGKKIIEKALQKYQILKRTFSKDINKEAIKENPNFTQLLELLEQKKTKRTESLLVRAGDKIIPLSISTVAFFFVEDRYTFAFTLDQKKHIVSQNLEQLEEICISNQFSFYRANRQFLVNRKAIKDVSQYFNRKLLINFAFSFPERVTINKTKVTDFLHWLENH